VFANAVPIAEFQGTVYAYSTNPSTTWHLWVKWKSVDGVESLVPAGGTNGLVLTTGQNVELLLDALAGEITASELHAALGTRINLIDADVSVLDSVAYRVNQEALARADADAAMASQITELFSSVDDTQASIVDEATTRADADNALSSSITTLTASANDNTAAIQTEASTRATQTGELYAQWTVKLDVNGYVSGFGLASTLADAVPYSQFIFKADQFAFGAPGFGTVYPFVIQATATTINGVSVPAGVYINAAYIENGTITNAKIGYAAIDDAKIANLSAAKITAGTLDAARIATGSLDAKIANLDAAVIGSGYINAARINSASIANASIDTAQIGSGYINAARINTASIANASINTAQIASATIGAAQIASGFIDAARINSASIANAVIGTAQISDAAITSAKIGSAAITSAKIGALAVETANIAGNAVTASNSSGGASTASTSINVPDGQTMKIVCLAFSGPLNFGGSPGVGGVNGSFNGAAYTTSSYSSNNEGSVYWNDSTTWVGYASVTGPATVTATVNGSNVTVSLMGVMR
jgi:hypothetical protein